MEQMIASAIEVERGSLIASRALPDGWRCERLGDISEVIAGQSPPGESYRKAPEGLPFFQGKADFGKIHPIPRTWCVAPNKIAVPGDILISVRAPVGPTNIADVECCIGRGLAAIRPFDIVDRDYLLAAIRFYEKSLVKRGSGSTFDAIGRDVLESLIIPLPPLPEQQRIAAILHEQMAAVERARAAAEAQLEAAKALPAGYLRAAFNSLEARQWPKKRLGDIALVVQNGLYKSAQHYGHGHPFVRMYNIQNNSWKLKLDRMALVNLEGNEEQAYSLETGDLLVSRVNSYELVGKCAIVSSEAEGHVFENMLIRLRFDPSVDPLFIAQQLNTGSLRQQIQAVAKKAIGQASINSTDLRNIEIAVPDLAEQEAISKDLDARIASVEPSINALQDQQDDICKLPAALLRRAFNGELLSPKL